MHKRIHWASLALLTPLLLASTCINREVVEEVDEVDIQPVEQDLQVVSIDPAWATRGEVFEATVYGAGFAQGARVRFGEETEAARVTFAGDVKLSVTVPPLEPGRWDVWVINPDGEMSVLRGALRVEEAQVAEPDCASATLYFDFDSSGLTASSDAQVQELAPCLTRNDGAIRLEGHCDERGTTEYNLALGQRRANSVEKALVALGVSPQRIDTISYGEERPAQGGSSESAWAENRRVELELIR